MAKNKKKKSNDQKRLTQALLVKALLDIILAIVNIVQKLLE